MKKTKLFTGLLMIALCVAVLGIGIYAVTPTSHSIVGVINVTAGGDMIEMQAYLRGTTSDHAVSEEVGARNSSKTLTIVETANNKFQFDCANAYDHTQVEPLMMYIRIENKSTQDLGAYFVETPVLENEETAVGNIAFSRPLYECDDSGEIKNPLKALVRANFNGYTKIPAKKEVFVPITLNLIEVLDSAFKVKLDLNLNIEKYDLPVSSNSVAFVSNGLDVEATCTVENASTTPEAVTLSSSGEEWNVGSLTYTSGTLDDVYALETIKLKMMVKNNNLKPIKVDVNKIADANREDIEIYTIGNGYIEPGKTAEVSVQFAVSESLTTYTEIPTVSDYACAIETTEIDFIDKTPLQYVEHDSTAMGGRGFNFFINMGTNPYYNAEEAQKQGNSYPHRQYLRWYIGGKLNSMGGLTALVEGEGKDYLGTTFLGGGNYVLFSEHVLANVAFGDICNYQEQPNAVNAYKYLSGLTVKSAWGYNTKYQYDAPSQFLPVSDNLNLYSTFRLNEYHLFNSITQQGGFRLLSGVEAGKLFPYAENGHDRPNAEAYVISDGTKMNWAAGTAEKVEGVTTNYFSWSGANGVRPAFALEILTTDGDVQEAPNSINVVSKSGDVEVKMTTYSADGKVLVEGQEISVADGGSKTLGFDLTSLSQYQDFVLRLDVENKTSTELGAYFFDKTSGSIPDEAKVANVLLEETIKDASSNDLFKVYVQSYSHMGPSSQMSSVKTDEATFFAFFEAQQQISDVSNINLTYDFVVEEYIPSDSGSSTSDITKNSSMLNGQPRTSIVEKTMSGGSSGGNIGSITVLPNNVEHVSCETANIQGINFPNSLKTFSITGTYASVPQVMIVNENMTGVSAKTGSDALANANDCRLVSLGSAYDPASDLSSYNKTFLLSTNEYACTDLQGRVLSKDGTILYRGLNKSSITSSDIPYRVTTLGYGAFCGMNKASSIDLRSTNISVIKSRAFSSCPYLSTLILPSTLKTIEAQAVTDMKSLTSIGESGLVSKISFAGTAEQWAAVSKDAYWNDLTNLTINYV